MRPAQLTTVRARLGRRLGSHTFRGLDLFFLWCLTGVAVGGTAGRPFAQATVAQVAPLLAGAVLAARLLRSMKLYGFGRGETLGSHLLRVLGAAGLAGASAAALTALLEADQVVHHAVWAWAAGAASGLVGLHVGWWSTVRRWRRQGWLTPNVVIVGATTQAERLIRQVLDRRDAHVLGVFDDRLARSPLNLLGVPVLGGVEALLTHHITPSVDLIVVAIDPSASARVARIRSLLATLPNRVTLLIDQDDPADPVGRTGRLHPGAGSVLAQLADGPLAPLDAAADLERKALAKRIQDLAIGVPALVVLAPLLALIALAVKLDSPGPVFFRQRRHGFNNEEIEVWKFRTMHVESTDLRGERQVTAGDPRVTRMGRILRRTSLDELPQLVNVLRDEMSLVGPRPHAVGMRTGDVPSAQLVADYAQRHRMKPGMTGWAAINGSRGPLLLAADVKRRVALDVEYIDRQSFWFDLAILLRTIPSVLGDRTTIR